MASGLTAQRSPDVISRSIAGESLLIPITGNLADMQKIFALNPVAEFIWERLDGKMDMAAIRDAVCSRYDIDPETAESDIREFVEAVVAASLGEFRGRDQSLDPAEEQGEQPSRA